MKIVVSLYGDAYPGQLDPAFAGKIANEGVADENLALLGEPSYENLCRFVLQHADGVVAASADVAPRCWSWRVEAGKPLLEYQSPDAADFSDNYKNSMNRSISPRPTAARPSPGPRTRCDAARGLHRCRTIRWAATSYRRTSR